MEGLFVRAEVHSADQVGHLEPTLTSASSAPAPYSRTQSRLRPRLDSAAVCADRWQSSHALAIDFGRSNSKDALS